MEEDDKAYKVGPTGPVLIESVVAFLDALGTQEKASDPVAAQDRLDRLWTVFTSASIRDLLDNSLGTYEVSAFTDNVVIGVPGDPDTDWEMEYGLLLTLTAHYQLQLSLNGVFVRGGIAAGPLWMNNSFVFGAGLNSAYSLETRSAVYPRVVVESDIAELARHHVMSYYGKPAESPQNAHLVVAADGLTFVNYLVAAEDYDDPVTTLNEHRTAVIEGLFDSRSAPAGVIEKSMWAAEYHNWYSELTFPDEQHLLVPDRPRESLFFRLIEET